MGRLQIRADLQLPRMARPDVPGNSTPYHIRRDSQALWFSWPRSEALFAP